MEISARCPYCASLNTYVVEPNVAVVVTCTCGKGSFYVKKVDRIEVSRNSLWVWDEGKNPAGTSLKDDVS